MQPLFIHNQAYQVALVIAIAVFGVVGLPAQLRTLKMRVERSASPRDRGSYWAVQAVTLAGVVLGYQLAMHYTGATITWQRPVVFGAGIALILLGSAVNWHAIRELGRFFTVQVAVRRDQQVVQSGLYRLVRHPAYSGQLLVFLGLGLALTNWASIAAVMICAMVGYTYRVTIEERVLRNELGQAYAENATRTSRFIPYVF